MSIELLWSYFLAFLSDGLGMWISVYQNVRQQIDIEILFFPLFKKEN